MKNLKAIFITICLLIPVLGFSQSNATRKDDTTKSQKSYRKKTYTKTTRTYTDTIRKENAPVLNDNGSVNTTGAIDGSRSSTGRPGADTLVNYTTKKSKRTIKSGRQATIKDTTKASRNQP